jgi:opacity protein-like surface antigen
MVKRFLILAAALVVVIGAAYAPAHAQQNRYGWTISNSQTDPLSNTGSATNVLTTLYLWFQCNDRDGMSAAEFDIAVSGMTHIATIPVNGFLNAGGTSDLLLAVGACPEGPVVAANLLVIDVPGSLCLAPSVANGNRGTVDCSDTRPELWNLDWVGYSNSGGLPCQGGALCDSPLEDRAWGTVKGRYKS